MYQLKLRVDKDKNSVISKTLIITINRNEVTRIFLTESQYRQLCLELDLKAYKETESAIWLKPSKQLKKYSHEKI